MARSVLIATPTTLLAMLRAVAYGWQQERVAESAQAVSELGRELHGRLVKLSELLGTLGTRLNSAVRAYNDTIGSYEARVLPGARRFADHGAAAGGREFPDLEHVTLNARSVHAPELVEAEDADAGRKHCAAAVRRRRPDRGSLPAGKRRLGGAVVPVTVLPPQHQVFALVRQWVGARLAHLDDLQRAVDVEVLADRDDSRRHRGRALPSGAAVEVDAVALIQPLEHLLDRGLELVCR